MTDHFPVTTLKSPQSSTIEFIRLNVIRERAPDPLCFVVYQSVKMRVGYFNEMKGDLTPGCR